MNPLDKLRAKAIDTLSSQLPPTDSTLIVIAEGAPAFHVHVDLTPREAVLLLLEAALWVAEDRPRPEEQTDEDVTLEIYGALLEARRMVLGRTGESEEAQ
jgi:hypothetical protein